MKSSHSAHSPLNQKQVPNTQTTEDETDTSSKTFHASYNTHCFLDKSIKEKISFIVPAVEAQ